MSAGLLCASCFHPIEPDDLTQIIVLGDAVTSLGALCLQTAEVHVDCADPRGEFVYDCRRRFPMTERNTGDRDEQELGEDEQKLSEEDAAAQRGAEGDRVREELQRDREPAADRE